MISFRAPFAARLAFRFLTCSFRLPYVRTPAVPTNANTAAVHARCLDIQSRVRSIADVGGRAGCGKYFVDSAGRIDDGVHDWWESVSRRVEAAWSMCRSMASATCTEYRLTSFGIDANYPTRASCEWGTQLLFAKRLRTYVVKEKLIIARHPDF